MASRITHLAIKSQRFFFLKCTFFLINRGQVKEWSIYSCRNKTTTRKKINQCCPIRFEQWGPLYLWLHDISTRCTASRWHGCWSPYFVVSPMDSRVNLMAFFLCFFNFDNYALIILLPAPEWFKKKVHSRKKYLGDLIARRVIRDAMMPSFSSVF